MAYSYQSLYEFLIKSGIEINDAKQEAFLLLSHFCGVSRADCLCDRTKIYDVPALDQAAEQRAGRYPLQYILGTWCFFGLDFEVSPHCLIPRPDTELLVETAIKMLPPNATFVDLCTGSGCIAVAVLKNRPDTRAVALELYPDTLALAVKNAKKNGVADRLTPICADLLKEGLDVLQAHAPFHAILSNPPYIPKSVVDELAPELFFEPRAALDGGEDGLVFYAAILKDYQSLLTPGGIILLEIGYDQADDLKKLAQNYMPNATYTCLKDLGGQDRVVCLSTTNATNA